MSSRNLETVQAIYAAFGRGDLPAVLEAMAEDVDWCEVGDPADFSAFGARRGKAAVADFFRTLAETADFTGFEIEEMDAAGDKVFVVGTAKRVFRRSGREGQSRWCQIWTLREGKVIRFLEFTDTAAIARAYGG
jgi:uncharacterized protein